MVLGQRVMRSGFLRKALDRSDWLGRLVEFRCCLLGLSAIFLFAAQLISVQACQQPEPDQARIIELLRLREAQLRAAQLAANQFQKTGNTVTLEILNNQLFGQNGSEEDARKRYDVLLKIEIARLSQACRLTPDQLSQAELAGRGDIIRLLNQFEDFRQRFQGISLSAESLSEIRRQALPLRATLNMNSFGEQSLLHRRLFNILDEQQATRLEALNSRRRQALQLEAAGRIAQTINARSPFSDDHRRALAGFLMSETKPPPLTPAGAYDNYYLLLQVKRLPRDRLRSVFDDVELTILDDMMQAAQTFEPRMRALGYFPLDDAGVETTATPKW